MLDAVTPVLITFNEEDNIARTLAPLAWARRIVVVDSFSTDRTLEILRADPRVQVVQRAFASFADQWTYAIQGTGIDTEWVLALDADYVLTGAFVDELRSLRPAAGVDGYDAAFRCCVHGRVLRGGLYPPVTVLYRRSRASYRSDGHAHRVVLRGPVQRMRERLLNDDRKPLTRWLAAEVNYSLQEAEHLRSQPWARLKAVDKLRRAIFFAPPAMFLYCLIVRGLILDGWPGWFYTVQRTVSELMLSLRLIDALVRRRASS